VQTCWFTDIFVWQLCLLEISRSAASATATARFFTSRLLRTVAEPGWNHRQLSRGGHPGLHRRFAWRLDAGTLPCRLWAHERHAARLTGNISPLGASSFFLNFAAQQQKTASKSRRPRGSAFQL
jgi:hypothetical protein